MGLCLVSSCPFFAAMLFLHLFCISGVFFSPRCSDHPMVLPNRVNRLLQHIRYKN